MTDTRASAASLCSALERLLGRHRNGVLTEIRLGVLSRRLAYVRLGCLVTARLRELPGRRLLRSLSELSSPLLRDTVRRVADTIGELMVKDVRSGASRLTDELRDWVEHQCTHVVQLTPLLASR